MSIDRDIIVAQLACKQFRKIVDVSHEYAYSVHGYLTSLEWSALGV
jgi:hypothetical protein